MPVQVERLPNEPILIATFSGAVDVSTLRDMFNQTAQLIVDMEYRVYRISDYNDALMTTPDLVAMVQMSGKAISGSSADPRIEGVLVGNNQWVRTGRILLGQLAFKGKHIPLFNTRHDALRYVRRRINSRKETKPLNDNDHSATSS